MPSDGGALTWHARALSRYVRRDVRMADGTAVSVWAFPRGIRPARRWSMSFEPDTVSAIRLAYEYVRYRTAYRGAWVIEIRNPDSDLPHAERAYRSRAAAMDAFDETCHRLARLPLEHIGQALARS